MQDFFWILGIICSFLIGSGISIVLERNKLKKTESIGKLLINKINQKDFPEIYLALKKDKLDLLFRSDYVLLEVEKREPSHK